MSRGGRNETSVLGCDGEVMVTRPRETLRAELPSYFTAALNPAGRRAIRRAPDEINVHAGGRGEKEGEAECQCGRVACRLANRERITKRCQGPLRTDDDDERGVPGLLALRETRACRRFRAVAVPMPQEGASILSRWAPSGAAGDEALDRGSGRVDAL